MGHNVEEGSDENSASFPTQLGNVLDRLQIEVDRLYDLKEDYSISKEERESRLSETVKKTSEELEGWVSQMQNEPSIPPKKKAYAFYLQGKAINALLTYDRNAENLLSKAIRLDPALIDAWNCLGECFWKKDDLISAKNCFMGAMDQAKTPNKVSLRRLSMVLRQLGKDAAEKSENAEESVKKAKEAVSLDIKDGTSWYILGNSYLAKFFLNSNDLEDMKRALSAYQQAENSPNSVNLPDLHYNRAVIHKYKEDFQLAIDGFLRAASLDTWEAPQTEINAIVDFFDKVGAYFNPKGRTKPKHVTGLVQSIPETVTVS
eukprot:TRINITY_DN10563_c0_g1_i1.p1 TRINITY_DN10563_c0_g1~~TRINITY_DN10563_c0_g1_i1.p1  ORF type:complete len:317 (+),score=54.93 TRINITY_DN10563_c0_g1_i1:32-982(+)